MRFFEGLGISSHNYLPRYPSWIEREFDRYALNFCSSGRLLWAMDGGELQLLAAPVAWWTVPAHSYAYGVPPSEIRDHFFITMTGPRVAQMAREQLIPSASPHFRRLSDGASFERTFRRLFEVLEHDGYNCPRAVWHMEDLWLQLEEQAPPDALTTPLEKVVREWVEQVRANPQHAWSVPQSARELAISEGHFRRLVCKIVGVPPHHFILERRLECCATRLRSTNDPIKVLMNECGFGDLPHFTRLFGRKYGLSPAAYRRETQLLSSRDATPTNHQ